MEGEAFVTADGADETDAFLSVPSVKSVVYFSSQRPGQPSLRVGEGVCWRFGSLYHEP